MIGGIKEIKMKGLNDFVVQSFNKYVFIAEYNTFIVKFINSLPRLILEMSSITLIIVLFFIYEYLNYNIGSFLPILSLVAISAVRAIPSIGNLVRSFNNIIFLSPSVNLIHRDLISEKEEKKSLKKIMFFNLKKIL